MSRHAIALALFIAAAVCFAVALASIVGTDVDVYESAWLSAGFLFTAVAFVVERLR